MLTEIKALLKAKQEEMAMQESTEVLANEMNILSNKNKDFLESVLILNEETENEEIDEEKKEPELDDTDEELETNNIDNFDNEEISNNMPEFPDNNPKTSNTGEEENSPESDNSENDEPEEDPMNTPVEEPETNSENEPDNSNEYDPDSLENQVVNDDLSNPDDVILSTEINISTGTPTDTLPLPPTGAGDSVASEDPMNQRIDSGFDNEEVPEDEYRDVDQDDIMNSPVVDYGANGNDNSDEEEPTSEPETNSEENQENNSSEENNDDYSLENATVPDNIDDYIIEEITISDPPTGDDSTNTDPVQDPNTEAPADANVTPEDTTGTGGTTDANQPSENSPVTDEVLNQVNDGNDTVDDSTTSLDNPEPASSTETTPTNTGTDNLNSQDPKVAENIFKKLADITKNVEDAKSQVIQMLSKNNNG